MTVLSIGYPLFPVARDASGGSEQILCLLDHELVQAGNRSVVIGAKGSQVAGKLVETPGPREEITDEDRRAGESEHLRAIETAIKHFPIDLIHFHGLDFHAYIPRTNIPMLATLHLPLEWYPEHVFKLRDVTLNCVSHSQAGTSAMPVVLNGIDVRRYRPMTDPGDYMLWMGRICPEKGVHLALEAAHRSGLPLVVAGPVHRFQSHQEYFEQKVRPLLHGGCRYIGPVQGDRKIELLANARCVLVPSLVAETSSLVSMEAIACGTPVVALRSGALPEVVEHGRTGFVCESVDEIVASLPLVQRLDRRAIRDRALVRFDARRMATDYLKLYSQVRMQKHAPAAAANAAS